MMHGCCNKHAQLNDIVLVRVDITRRHAIQSVREFDDLRLSSSLRDLNTVEHNVEMYIYRLTYLNVSDSIMRLQDHTE